MKYSIYEDKEVSKLPICLSTYLRNKIEEIKWDNRFEKEKLEELKTELTTVLNQLSNRSLAFSYVDGDMEDENGYFYKNIFGYDVAFKLISICGVLYVYIDSINFNLEDIGLVEKQRKTLSAIITEVLNQYLKENLITE